VLLSVFRERLLIMAGEMRRRGGGGSGGGADGNVIKFYTDDSHGFEL